MLIIIKLESDLFAAITELKTCAERVQQSDIINGDLLHIIFAVYVYFVHQVVKFAYS